MPEGAPPPCLINMKEIWSSTHLSIGEDPSTQCSYWTPLYGDVFGVLQQDQLNYEDEPVDKTKHWGDFRFLEELPTHATRRAKWPIQLQCFELGNVIFQFSFLCALSLMHGIDCSLKEISQNYPGLHTMDLNNLCKLTDSAIGMAHH
ncbi:hypothetical protein T459_12849 [Capsicum annuum]|uniref:Uncharacterized protein n=1 Tax=Capsicum annuum TaxID=4072 RepID=A0A2G2ZQZ0_CAPAN|nr:hypothetical protein T459_12849 [Capsicum annuum]